MSEAAPGEEDLRYNAGIGNWQNFGRAGFGVEEVHRAAEDWAAALRGVERPWLCWNVDPDWNLVQQRLVSSAGWTPVVGFDPRIGPPPVERDAILIDFNARFKLPTMWLHFPLEFVHRFAPRLAFWHADCLIRFDKMRHLAELFASLEDGEAAAVDANESILVRLRPKRRRYWEVVGCMTRKASQDCFDKGAGWWLHFAEHVSNSPAERAERSKYYWDSGAGIRYWHRKLGGRVRLVPEDYIAEGHFTGIGRSDYKRASPKNQRRNLGAELSLNNNLVECCRKLGLERLLEESEAAA